MDNPSIRPCELSTAKKMRALRDAESTYTHNTYDETHTHTHTHNMTTRFRIILSVKMRAPTFAKYLPSTVDDPKALPNTNSQLPRACRQTAMQSGPAECAKQLNKYIHM